MEKKAQEKMARRSSENTLKVASDAMVKFGIQKVLILARPRRNDQMEKLSTLSNEILRELCFKRNGIFFVDNKGGMQKYYPARALRALGLLLADGTPTGGRGEDFLSCQPDFFTETAVTPERKVEKSFPRWEINRHAKG